MMILLSSVLILFFVEICFAKFLGLRGRVNRKCGGSQCNQNYFGRRKNEALSEILDMAEDDDNNEDKAYKDNVGQESNEKQVQKSKEEEKVLLPS